MEREPNIVKEPSADVLQKINGTEIVFVACKLPHGLWLEILEDPPQPPAGHSIHQLANFRMSARRVGEPIKLNGSKTMMPGGPHARFAVAQGQHLYAITRVPKDFWERWFKANRDLEFVKRGLVFALEDKNDAIAKAKEGATVTTGIEAVNAEIDKDPRAPQAWKPEERVETDKAHLDHLYRQRLQYQAGIEPGDLPT